MRKFGLRSIAPIAVVAALSIEPTTAVGTEPASLALEWHHNILTIRRPAGASDPIPGGPFAVRGNLPAGFKARLTEVLRTLDLSSLPERDMKILGRAGSHGLVAVNDADFNGIRDVVQVLHVDLSKMNE